MTLIELQEDKEDRRVAAVSADGPGRVRVELADGRVHRWQVSGLDATESRPAVELHLTEEGADGSRSEETAGT